MDDIEKVQIHIYKTQQGHEPFTVWFDELRDTRAKSKIQARLARIRLGNFGVCKGVGSGVFELKIDFGPGYRVYFGQSGAAVVLLLCGGDKKSQKKDIKKAYFHWSDYRRCVSETQSAL